MSNLKEEACRKAFTQALLELAKKDSSIIALTTDATGSVSLGDFKKELPEQFIEVGIAEQDMVGISAGLAAFGKKPFACGPASFMSARSLEQIKIDVAYSNTNVKLIGVSGGVSYGALGESHYSVQDLATMRAIANLTVILPSDAVQTTALTEMLTKHTGPVYMRMGRGAVPDIYNSTAKFEIGKAYKYADGCDVTIIATGEMVYNALRAAELLKAKGISAGVVDMFTIDPVDKQAIITAANETGAIVTVEEHCVHGGLGAAVAEVVVENCPVAMKIIGFPPETLIGGTPKQIHAHYGLNPESIADKTIILLKKKSR